MTPGHSRVPRIPDACPVSVLLEVVGSFSSRSSLESRASCCACRPRPRPHLATDAGKRGRRRPVGIRFSQRPFQPKSSQLEEEEETGRRKRTSRSPWWFIVHDTASCQSQQVTPRLTADPFLEMSGLFTTLSLCMCLEYFSCISPPVGLLYILQNPNQMPLALGSPLCSPGRVSGSEAFLTILGVCRPGLLTHRSAGRCLSRLCTASSPGR